ncbi:MAG TPA: GNAT family N-acetyltransferase [Burkholderiales bacterium]|nr:GNAT family N-acetyltransferase [Burkholderiales bacterium]
MEVTFHSDPAGLAPLVPEWQSLAARAVEPNPFYEDWMVLPALEAFGAAGMAFASVRERGELVGLFPLVRRARFRGLVRTLQSWRHAHSMLGVPLLRGERAAEVLTAFFEAARAEADLVEFSHLPSEGPFEHALIEALGSHRVTLADGRHTRPLLRRAADGDAYVRSVLSSDTRSEARRNEKRLAAQGRVERRVLRAGDDVGRWIEEFLALEASGWKGRQGSALACNAANRRFAEAIFRGGFERGRLAMVGLDLDGRPIARYTAFVGGAGAFAFKTTFDEGLRSFAPGILAEIDMIKALHERPGLEWADSYTGPGNTTLGRFWKSRRAVQRLAVGLSPAGELLLALAPLARWIRRRLPRLQWRRAGRAAASPSAPTRRKALQPQ